MKLEKRTIRSVIVILTVACVTLVVATCNVTEKETTCYYIEQCGENGGYTCDLLSPECWGGTFAREVCRKNCQEERRHECYRIDDCGNEEEGYETGYTCALVNPNCWQGTIGLGQCRSVCENNIR